MKHARIRCVDTLPQPWRNGGGLTREWLAWPPGAGIRGRLLHGPTRSLNLMLRGEVGGPQTAVAGPCWADGDCIDLPAQTLLWFRHAPAELHFDPLRHPLLPQPGRPAPAGWWISASPTPAAA